MTSDDKINQAKSTLMRTHPYFGMLASRLTHESSDKPQSFLSNGKIFRYNPNFIQNCSIEEIIFVLSNCVMHHVLAHQKRQDNRTSWLWQVATDFAINSLLVQNGLKVPSWVNYDASFNQKYAEEIYAILLQQIDQMQSSDTLFTPTTHQNQQIAESKEPESQTQKAQELFTQSLDDNDEAAWRYAESISTEMAKRQSALPTGMERLSKKVITNNADWRFLLYAAINRHMRNDYAFMPPNKKFLHLGVALPSLRSDTLSLCVAIDSSGSINEQLLGAFLSEFENIMQSFPAVKIEMLIADAKIQGHYTFQSSQPLKYTIKGGGGTDFRPVFDYIEANLPMTSMLLYFTDGDGRFPKKPPHYEVLWALSRKSKIPFGKVVELF
ncbi:MAG: hypothetical protein K0U47_03190 [Epsilonproteobacteria bacterium]|nr:hypothetical protein [Campylobacterota bacterium]